MDASISPPALVIGGSSIDKIRYRYLVADKRLISQAFRNVRIVDSKRQCLDIERVIQAGGLDLLYSLKVVGYMVRVDPILKRPVFRMDLEELKGVILTLVEREPYPFNALMCKEDLKQEVCNAESLERLIAVF